MKRSVIRTLIHCIASLAAARLMTSALAQGSRPISLRDAQRWQELQGQADAALAKGDYGQTEALHRQSLAVHERQLTPDHPATLAILANLGGVILL